jgi:hypothetical protein
MTSTASPTEGLDRELRTALAESLGRVLREDRGRHLAVALQELGWDDVVGADEVTATNLLFEQHGRALAASSALSDTVLRALSPLAQGPLVLMLPHPSDDPVQPGGAGVRGLLLEPLEPDATVLVPTSVAGRVVLHSIPADWIAERAHTVAGFDTARAWQLVDTPEAPPGDIVPCVGDWEEAVALGRRALSAEIIGVCRAALAIAVAHTTSRHQYGRAIGSFQAVRHRLAEAHVAVESAAAVLDAAWSASSPDDAETPSTWASAAAKARAGLAQAEVMRTCVQVLGAMGLTEESDMHRHVERAALLDALLGGHRRIEQDLGAALLAGTAAYPLARI